jgi:hypothetical protein
MENLYGGGPPVAETAEEYNAPTVPVLAGHASVGGLLAVIVIEQPKVAGGFPLRSVTVIVKAHMTATVGVPTNESIGPKKRP